MPADLNLVLGRAKYTSGAISLVLGFVDAPPNPDPLTAHGTTVLAPPSGAGLALYDNRNPRRVSAGTTQRHQPAIGAGLDLGMPTQAPTRHLGGFAQPLQSARAAEGKPRQDIGTQGRVSGDSAQVHQVAKTIGAGAAQVHQALARVRAQAAQAHQVARALRAQAAQLQEAGTLTHTRAAQPLQQAQALRALAAQIEGAARFLNFTHVQPFQGARRVPPGKEVWPPIDGGNGPEPYVPDLNLVFACPPYAPGALIGLVLGHECVPEGPTATLTIPVRRAYIVINNTSLRRVSDNAIIPCFDLSLALDTESWAWGFSASTPLSAQGLLLETEAVELSAMINGTEFRLVVEDVQRDRTFGRTGLRVAGKGRNTFLDAPYAPQLNFGNSNLRTAQQLMLDALTINGTPLGWAVDWQLTDWLVPAGAFAHQGTYRTALSAIAGAAGGFIRPHPSAMSLSVVPRYPIAPWDWGTAVPAIELPSAVVSREGLRWVSKPEYTRVFVSGEGVGVLGDVTRAGTAGDLVAPMVVDPLITAVDAARQRGLSVLADTGRQKQLSLRLPVLPETGIIQPGTLLRYVDEGATHLGLVRGVNVDVRFPSVHQTLEVESHE